jgi:hypothetical protein
MNTAYDVIMNTTPSDIYETLANFLNYLNVSLYEGQFTQRHEEARANLNAIYDAVAATAETTPPTKAQLVSFYTDICVLEKVTDTDDPIYYTYKRLLRRYIASLELNTLEMPTPV